MPKVLVTDHTFEPLDIEQRVLEPVGGQVLGHQCKSVEALLPLVADVDAVITQFSPLTAEVIAAMLAGDVIRCAGCEPVTLDELLAQSDIVTLHCPSTPQSKKLLITDSLARMKRGAVVLNLARGDLIDTAALVAALQSGQISAAALDVCDPEPIPADSPLRSLPNVIAASHIASASPKAVRTLRETAARIAAMALRGEALPNIVNGVKS